MHKVHTDDPPGLYPMRLVTRLTGLSADTIRAWERRHGAVTPSRSAGNTRRFTAVEVRRLVLLREATEVGHSIRSIAPLDIEQLERLIDRDARIEAPPSAHDGDSGVSFRDLRHAYLAALARLDTRRAFDLLMRGATFLDRKTFAFEVVLPVLEEVADRWSDQAFGSLQKQLVSEQLRAVLMTLTRLSPPALGAGRLLMTTLAGQGDEFRILVSALLATAHGKDPVYVGPSLSVDEVEWAVHMSRADVLVTSASGDPTPDMLEQFSQISDRLRPGVKVWCSIPRGHPLTKAVSVDLYFHDFLELISSFRGLSEAQSETRPESSPTA